MNALTHEFDLSRATMLAPLDQQRVDPQLCETLAAQWAAVHEAAAAVGALAQLGRTEEDAAIAGLPARAEAAGGHAFELVRRGVDDLAAMMRPGLRALLALSARGKDPTVAALTLWREFHDARDAIVGLAPVR